MKTTLELPDALFRKAKATAAERGQSIKEFCKAKGLVTHYVLFLISLADRVVRFAGITTQPTHAWMAQSGVKRASHLYRCDTVINNILSGRYSMAVTTNLSRFAAKETIPSQLELNT
jgi:hypothetical protein